MNPRHPLYGARLRVDRAKVPIRSARLNMQKWAELHWDHINITLDDKGHASADPYGNVIFERIGEPPIERLGNTSVWIGEALYNLRSALDYLVYAVATMHNGGKHVRQTQFPIEDDVEGFLSRITGFNAKTQRPAARYLRKVPMPIAMRLMDVQPFAGCQWTKDLRELSNFDKHRFLSELTSSASVVAGNHPDIAHVPEKYRVHPHIVVSVTFRGGDRDVIDTLVLIQREADALLREFERAYGAR